MTDRPPASDRTSAALPRREFLQTTALTLLGASALPVLGCARTDEPPRAAPPDAPLPAPGTTTVAAQPVAKLGLQLYTVRDAYKTDLAGTMKKVAALGVQAVETAFWYEGTTLQQGADAIRNAGLAVSSAHIELPVGNARKAMLDAATAYDTSRMIWHGWPEDPRYSTLEGTKALAAIYNDANRFAQDNGLTFGLHNHWWEYRNRVGGKAVYEVLLEELDPTVFFEVDTYWVKVAGYDPAAIVRQLGPRAPFLHIKDGPAVYHETLATDNPDPMTAVGKGAQDFPAIARAGTGTVEWMVVEMDKVTGDVFTALEESVRYLTSNNFAAGKPPG
jgi:sugar phosphate isomerase/epimerase